MSSLQWYLSKNVAGNGVLLQFLRKIISPWMDLIVRTFIVYLAWLYSAPSLFHTFSPSCAFQNGSFPYPHLFSSSFLSHFPNFLWHFLCCWGGKSLYSEYSLVIPIEVVICLRMVCQLFLSLTLGESHNHCLFFCDDYFWNKTFYIIHNVSIMCIHSFLFQEEIDICKCLSRVRRELSQVGTPVVERHFRGILMALIVWQYLVNWRFESVPLVNHQYRNSHEALNCNPYWKKGSHHLKVVLEGKKSEELRSLSFVSWLNYL